jgi:RNA polymerase sigma factor (sigma-70 family)
MSAYGFRLIPPAEPSKIGYRSAPVVTCNTNLLMPRAPQQLTSAADFPTTNWTFIVKAQGSCPANQAALSELCRVYWTPLYAFMRRQGSSPHDAQDLVQGFFERLLSRDDLSSVAPEKGRFRTFLLTSLKNFSINQAVRNHAQKRGGGKVAIPLDLEEAERLSLPDLSSPSPEAAFDRQWARTIIQRALTRLHVEHRARKKEMHFETLVPLLEGAESAEYHAAGVKLGMRNGTVAVAVHRLRARLQEMLRLEVLETVGNANDAEEELRHLLLVLSQL